MSREKFKVMEIPGLTDPIESYAGQISVSGEDTLFFWLFPAPKEKPRKLVIWLNGGPGCSSLDGLFLEIGAVSIRDAQLSRRKTSWSDHVDVLYLDQPIGTGYSQGRLRTNMTEIIKDFVTFVDKFKSIFIEYNQADIYLAGESYAGIYIPLFARQLLETNEIMLKGIMLGNPWFDPTYQYPAYIPFAQSHGVVQGKYLERAQQQLEMCVKQLIQPLKQTTYSHCERVLKIILDGSKDGGEMRKRHTMVKNCINKYDYRLRDNGPNEGCGMSWPPGVYDMANYMSTEKVKQSLNSNFKGDKWFECSWEVYGQIVNDNTAPTVYVIKFD